MNRGYWLLLAPSLVCALPQEGAVAAGSAEFAQPDPQRSEGKAA